MYDGVNEINGIAQVVHNEPQRGEVVKLPEYRSSDDKHHVVQNSEGYHCQPLRKYRKK